MQRFLSISEPLCKNCYYGRQQTNKRENDFPCSFIYRKLAHDFLRLPPPPLLPFREGEEGGGLAPAEGKEKRGEERVYVRSMPVVGRRGPEKDHKCTKPPPMSPIPGNRQATTGNESCRLFLSLSLRPPFFLEIVCGTFANCATIRLSSPCTLGQVFSGLRCDIINLKHKSARSVESLHLTAPGLMIPSFSTPEASLNFTALRPIF